MVLKKLLILLFLSFLRQGKQTVRKYVYYDVVSHIIIFIKSEIIIDIATVLVTAM